MSITMYDAIDSLASSIPSNAPAVAGYVDGLYKWSDASWALFPHSLKVRIAVFANTDDGDVLDCEPGNCTPAQSVDWVLLRRAAGKDPIVYCNQLNLTNGLPAVRLAFQQRAVPDPHYWVANYDGVATIPAGTVGKQYTDNPPDNPYDTSVMIDSLASILNPAPAPPPPPPPVPIPFEGLPMELLAYVQDDPANPAANQGIWYYDTEVGLALHLADVHDVSTWQAANPNLKSGPVTFATHTRFLATCSRIGK